MNHGILYLDNKNGETSILVGKAENDLFPENSPILILPLTIISTNNTEKNL